MSQDGANGGREPEKDFKLGIGESLELDVLFCDLVAGRDHEPPFQVRLRGYRAGTDERIRVYFPLDDIEGPMLYEQILRGPVVRPNRADRALREEIPLEKRALTLTRYRVGNGTVRLHVRARDDRDVERFQRAVRDAAEKVVPELTARGFAVSGADVLEVARDLVRHRTPPQG